MPQPTADVDELVSANLALVGHLARETASRLPRHLDSDDLYGAGALALVQAAKSFDSSLGVPFVRFASTRVRGAMIDHMRQRDWATRSIRSRARALTTVTEELTRAMHRAPTESEVAAASGMTEQEVRQVIAGTDRASLLSLDPLTADDAGLGAGLVDGAPRPDEALVAAERVGYLRDAIAELPERPRRVVTGYYLENRQLSEIAEELGVTQSRVSQLRAEGLDLLHEALSRLLRDDSAGGSASASAGGSAGGGTPGGDPAPSPENEGIKARRREAYVSAVARRSSVRERADVQAYLAGASLHLTHGEGSEAARRAPTGA
ncbi:MAG: sigma-70 family polymerase sigma factor [Actinomycetota bacterium]|nr:sigma-70 family polymerase sigma factor [Actinomycetota bacterium]